MYVHKYIHTIVDTSEMCLKINNICTTNIVNCHMNSFLILVADMAAFLRRWTETLSSRCTARGTETRPLDSKYVMRVCVYACMYVMRVYMYECMYVFVCLDDSFSSSLSVCTLTY